MSKAVVHFQSRHETGNIFWILAEVRKIMQKERRITEYNDLWQAVQNCGSYEEALTEIGKHVTIADKDTLRVWKEGTCRRYDPKTGEEVMNGQ